MKNPCKIIDDFKKISSNTRFITVTENTSEKIILRPVFPVRDDAEKISKWRIQYYSNFFTWIKPGADEVMEWIKNYQQDNSDIMFFAETPPGQAFGQLAIYDVQSDKKTAEFGRIIRGLTGGPKGLMTKSAGALLNWGFSELNLETINLEVFADNLNAIKFYKKLGFKVFGELSFYQNITLAGIPKWDKNNPCTDEIAEKSKIKKVLEMGITKGTLKL